MKRTKKKDKREGHEKHYKPDWSYERQSVSLEFF